MSEEPTVDDVSMGTVRSHLREAGRYAVVVGALMAVDTVLNFLRAAYQVNGYVRLGLLAVSVILFIAAVLNGLAAFWALEDAGKVAWQIERLRNVLAVALLVTSAALAGFAYVHYTGASEPFADRVDAAQDERQSALEAAAAAEDPDVVDKHMETASAAQSDIQRYEMYNNLWRFIPTGLGVFSAGFCLLAGLNGLFTSPRPEVTVDV